MRTCNWTATYGIVYEITENDSGYDWDRKDEKIQLGWEPPEKMNSKFFEKFRGKRRLTGKPLKLLANNTTRANNELMIAKAEVSKNRHKRELIQEQIMCSKKLLDAAR